MGTCDIAIYNKRTCDIARYDVAIFYMTTCDIAKLIFNMASCDVSIHVIQEKTRSLCSHYGRLTLEGKVCLVKILASDFGVDLRTLQTANSQLTAALVSYYDSWSPWLVTNCDSWPPCLVTNLI